MEFVFKKQYWLGIGIGITVLVIDILMFRGTKLFVPIIVIAVTLAWIQYWMDFFVENAKQKALEAKFLEFVRNLSSAIKSGMPISRAISHVSTTDYGALSPYVRKLANQVEWAIPIHKALVTFGNETKNPVIRRALATVIEAEHSGGNVEDVLASITESLVEIKKIKLTRKTNIQGQLIQSYVIFFVFLAVMIVIQNLLIPYIAGVGGEAGESALGEGLGDTQAEYLQRTVKIDFSSIGSFFLSMGDWLTSLRGILLMLALIQGFFAGLVMGKLSEGDLASGIKHSLILMTIAFFVLTLAQGFAS